MIQAKKISVGKGINYRALSELNNNVSEGDKALAEFASISKEYPEDLKTKEDYVRLLLLHGKVQVALKLNDES